LIDPSDCRDSERRFEASFNLEPLAVLDKGVHVDDPDAIAEGKLSNEPRPIPMGNGFNGTVAKCVRSNKLDADQGAKPAVVVSHQQGIRLEPMTC
jgi:hypothetical protein